MSNDNLITQEMLKAQATIFSKLDKVADAISAQSQSIATLVERENDNRETIIRIGGDMRSCKVGCESEIKEIKANHQAVKDRLSNVEAISNGRGKVINWALGLLNAGLLVYIGVWLKK